MSFIILYKGRPLSYFYPNGNGSVKDIIGFSFNKYMTFRTKDESEKHIEYMKNEIRKRADFDLKLSIKLGRIFERFKIADVEKL